MAACCLTDVCCFTGGRAADPFRAMRRGAATGAAADGFSLLPFPGLVLLATAALLPAGAAAALLALAVPCPAGWKSNNIKRKCQVACIVCPPVHCAACVLWAWCDDLRLFRPGQTKAWLGHTDTKLIECKRWT